MPERSNPAGSALDEWIAEVGEEGVAAVEEARRQIEDGSTPGFPDMEQFWAYIDRRRRRSA